jgi:hypothetical protein
VASDWVAQPHYTGGTLVLFWDGRELIEVRMSSNALADAAAAADSLKARFFFCPVNRPSGLEYHAYDRDQIKRSGRGTTTWSGSPLKTFKTNDTAPLIMWAAAKGGR